VASGRDGRAGKRMYLWRAVDHEGEVLDMLVQRRRDTRRLAQDDAERERAAAAVKTWLLAQIEKKRPAPAADIGGLVPDEALATERLAA
jgi:hypothetical protein